MVLDKVESANLEAIRKAFLEVKFAERDKENVRKRMKNSDIKDIQGGPIKGIKQAMTPQQTREYLQELSEEVGLDAQTVQNLLTVLAATEGGSSESKSVLEKVSPSKHTFGYVAAASVSPEAGVDLIYVLYEAEVEMETPICFCRCECLKPKTHKRKRALAASKELTTRIPSNPPAMQQIHS